MNKERKPRLASHDIYAGILLATGSVTLFFIHNFRVGIINETALEIVCTINPMAMRIGTLFGYDSFVFLSHYFWTFLFPAFLAIGYNSSTVANAVPNLSHRPIRALFATLIALTILLTYPLSAVDTEPSRIDRLMFSNIYTIPIFSGLLVYLIAILLAWSARAILAKTAAHNAG
jgi:hypothetical protein